jgi:outer membrane protein assembly factor BamB
MNSSRFPQPLPADAARYLTAAGRLEQPIDLVDSIMAEVESTPQVRPAFDLGITSGLMLAAAAVLLALAVLVRLGAPNVGPAPTPVPLGELPSAGQVQNRFSIEADDVPAAFGHGFIWLTNATTGELVRMDPNNGSIATPLQVTEPGTEVAIAVTDSSVWVADRRDASLVELDPTSREERRRLPGLAGVSAIAVDGSTLWLLDREAGVVVSIDTTDGQTVRTIRITGSALLVGDGWVWVAGDDGSLIRIDPNSGMETGRVAIGMVADRLIGNGDSIVAVAAGEPLVRVGIGSMRVESRGAAVLAAASQDGGVWAVLPSGHIVRLDSGSLQPVAATAIDDGTTATLAIGGGALWTTGLDGAGGAALLKFERGV